MFSEHSLKFLTLKYLWQHALYNKLTLTPETKWSHSQYLFSHFGGFGVNWPCSPCVLFCFTYVLAPELCQQRQEERPPGPGPPPTGLPPTLVEFCRRVNHGSGPAHSCSPQSARRLLRGPNTLKYPIFWTPYNLEKTKLWLINSCVALKVMVAKICKSKQCNNFSRCFFTVVN